LKLHRFMVLLGMAAPMFAQYSGPAILSRGEAPAAMSAPRIDFRPFFTFGASWDDGLAGVSVNEKGDLASKSSYGLDFGWGVSGTHSWRRTKVGLDYMGSTNHYFQQTFYDTINHSLLLGITHQLTRRAIFSFRESAGMYSRNPGLLRLPQTVPFDPSTSYIPTTDFFDNRTFYSTTQADLAYQKTARLSFDFGGTYFTTLRRSKDLYDGRGEAAQGDMQYRISRRTTLGTGYGYQRFRYPGVSGGADTHAVNFSIGTRLSRLTEFTGYFGGIRGEMKFVETVQLSPIIAALLGITSSSRVLHTIVYAPNVGVRMSRTFSRGVAYVGAGNSVTPGNGLFLTSTALEVFGGYSYTGMRKWSFGASAGWTRSRSYGIAQGVYASESGSLSASRQLVRYVHFVVSYAARRYDSPDFNKYNRIFHSARIGLGFAPGDVPLRLW
jgi:hypothetical protein